MEEKGVFKSAVFGGFDRQSVLDYIKKMTDEAERKEKELTQELLESTQRNEELLSMTREKQDKIGQLEQSFAQEQEKVLRLGRDLERAAQELRKLQELMDSQNNELLIQNERVRQLQKRNEMLELKSKKYDESTMQLGCLLLDAQKKAEAIVKEAQAQAEEIKKDAHMVVEQAQVQAAGIVANANQSVAETIQGLEVVQSSYGEFKHKIMDSLKGIVKMLDEADGAIAQSKLFIGKEIQTAELEPQESLEQPVGQTPD